MTALSLVPRPASPVRIALCGNVALTGPDGVSHPLRGTQVQLVLAYLLLERRPVQRDELADLLWDGPLPDHWAGAIRGLVAKVRAQLAQVDLAEDTLVADRGILRLDLPPDVEVDALEAAAAVEQAAAALTRGAADDAARLARRAHRTLRSLFLPRCDGPWVRQTRDRLQELGRLAAQHEIEALLVLGDRGAAVQRADEAIAADPLDETAHHLLIRSLIEDGQQVRALGAYERLRRLLATEFGIRPAAATEALHRSLVDTAPPAPTDRAPARPRPGTPDAGPHASVFVGRAGELERLHGAHRAVVDGRRPEVVVISGEPGIGKTRLALELADQLASTPGPAVLWGRCRADAGLPYEPIAEALHERLLADEGATLRRVGAAADGLFALIPELAPRAGREPAAATTSAASTDAAMARAHLFRSVAAALGAISAEPTLWVIDDLQWASDDTLTLLEFVLDELDAPLLLVVTVRERSVALDAALGRLQRRVPITTIELEGLDALELSPLVTDLARHAGQDPMAVARTIRLRTGGNPFFIHEIAKDASRHDAPADPQVVPTAVRAWIERRVASLPADTAGVLDVAAVIGLELDFDVLLACSTFDEGDLLDRCDELLRAHLLTETASSHFAFPHAITRDAVYERQSATRRARLHQRVGQAIESMTPAGGRSSVLAHHFARAGTAMRAEALRHAMAAGSESLDQAAWSLAAEQLEAAAELARTQPEASGAAARAGALAQLGRARHGAGDAVGAREALDEAIEIARAHDLAPELATAVLFLVGGGGRGVAFGLADDVRATLLRDALDRLLASEPNQPEHDALAGALEGELALALLLTDQVEERVALVHRSLERARPAAPGPSLAQALLNVRIAKLGPRDVRDRLADADEVLALPGPARTAEQTLAALVSRHEDLLLLGDRRAAVVALDEATALADQHAHPYWRWVTATWLALEAIIDGRLDDAEQLAFEATTRQVGDHPEAMACLGVNLIDIRLYQGRAGELLDLVAAAADANPHIPCYRAVLALCAAQAGDAERASVAYDHFAAEHFTNIPADTNRLLTLGVLAHTTVDLDRRAHAGVLTDLLAPYAGQQIVLNCFGGGGSYWGPVAHQLGRLARLAGHDTAARWFDQASTEADDFGAPLAAARIAADR